MNKIQVSVVIPAFNEEKYIEDTLFSLLTSEQKTNLNYEVILVNNNSTDKTLELAEKFKQGMNLKIITETKQGRGAARARGFREAKGEFILSTDADINVYSGWIETLVGGLKNESVAVTTPCRVVDRSAFTNLIFNLSLPVSMFLYRILFGHFWLSGFSFGIKRSAYSAAGGFDPALHAQEDTDLSFKVAKVGKIKYLNKPIIVSGRRLKNGVLSAWLEYFTSYINVFYKKQNGYLDNPR